MIVSAANGKEGFGSVSGGAGGVVAGTGFPGGAGGNGGSGTNGGGAAGLNGAGGNGSGSVGGTGDAGNIAAGANGTQWSSSPAYGSGGGGAGGNRAAGNPGGTYGAGGGGGQGSGNAGSAGAQGIIVITYTPTNSIVDRGFAISADSSLGTNVSTSSLGAQSGVGSFSATVVGLSPNTTYYYRAYATNSNGTSYGSIGSITTGSATPARKMRLLEGYRIKLLEGNRLKLLQQ